VIIFSIESISAEGNFKFWVLLKYKIFQLQMDTQVKTFPSYNSFLK